MKQYYIGIDLGGMSAKAGLLDEDGVVHCMNRCVTSAADSPEVTAKKLAALADELISEYDIQREQVAAIGIGSPGVIDSARGVVVIWSNFHWRDVPLAELVMGYVHLPVYVTNDANAAALGEAKYGSGKNFGDSVMLTLGTGIGGGIVFGGKLFEGFRSAGGELGHTVIKRNGVRCTCGRKGCFECYASATALKRMTAKMMQRHPESLMWKNTPTLEEVSGKTAFVAAREGDRYGKMIVKEYIACLGEGIVNIVNLLRPQVIIIGGGVSNEGEYLISRVKKFVAEHIYAPESYAPLEIVRASLGNDAGVYGASAYARERGACARE